MAEKKNTDPGVVLTGPDGDEVTVSTPTGLSNYVFGSGYKVKDGTVEEARAALAELAEAQATSEADAAAGGGAQAKAPKGSGTGTGGA